MQRIAFSCIQCTAVFHTHKTGQSGGIPLEEVYKISHIGRLSLGVGESSRPPFTLKGIARMAVRGNSIPAARPIPRRQRTDPAGDTRPSQGPIRAGGWAARGTRDLLPWRHHRGPPEASASPRCGDAVGDSGSPAGRAAAGARRRRKRRNRPTSGLAPSFGAACA